MAVLAVRDTWSSDVKAPNSKPCHGYVLVKHEEKLR